MSALYDPLPARRRGTLGISLCCMKAKSNIALTFMQLCDIPYNSIIGRDIAFIQLFYKQEIKLNISDTLWPNISFILVRLDGISHPEFTLSS